MIVPVRLAACDESHYMRAAAEDLFGRPLAKLSFHELGQAAVAANDRKQEAQMADRGIKQQQANARSAILNHGNAQMDHATKTANYGGHGQTANDHPTGSPTQQSAGDTAQRSKAHVPAPAPGPPTPAPTGPTAPAAASPTAPAAASPTVASAADAPRKLPLGARVVPVKQANTPPAQNNVQPGPTPGRDYGNRF